MKITIIIFLLSLANILHSQQAECWMKSLESPEYSEWQLNDENVITNYVNHDFSELLMPRTEILGFIGESFRRIVVKYQLIRKEETSHNSYSVNGFTIVQNNQCDFKGTIDIQEIREFKQMHYGVDNQYKGEGIQSQGILIGKFEFKENPEQNHVGVFSGIMTLWWYKDKNGKVQYDNIEINSDNYKNNQYVGTWTTYDNLKSKVCNWGEYRIPLCGDLDIGAAEFSVNEKYYKMGWKSYSNQY